jgi:hypothetical protein
MKKILTVTLLIAVFALASCGDKDDDDPCNCLATYGTTAHLGISETCACGGKPCNCTEEKNTTAILGITIRRDKTITSAQMSAKINGDIAAAWTNLAGDQSKFKDDIGVKEIHIVPGDDTTRTRDIVSIGIDATTGAVNSYFWGVANGHVQAPQKPMHYMALVTQKMPDTEFVWRSDKHRKAV